jgi:hypothetical protein
MHPSNVRDCMYANTSSSKRSPAASATQEAGVVEECLVCLEPAEDAVILQTYPRTPLLPWVAYRGLPRPCAPA